LPEKPRNEQRVTFSDAMKEKRAQIAATQAKGYTLEEIVQEAERIRYLRNAMWHAVNQGRQRLGNLRQRSRAPTAFGYLL
jgi:hypothetical protein